MLLACVEDGHNVLVLQSASRLGFAEEALTRIVKLLTLELLAQRHGLDRHYPADFGVLAKVDHTHGSLAEFFFNLVAAQHRLFDGAAVQQHGAAGMRAAA